MSSRRKAETFTENTEYDFRSKIRLVRASLQDVCYGLRSANVDGAKKCRDFAGALDDFTKKLLLTESDEKQTQLERRRELIIQWSKGNIKEIKAFVGEICRAEQNGALLAEVANHFQNYKLGDDPAKWEEELRRLPGTDSVPNEFWDRLVTFCGATQCQKECDAVFEFVEAIEKHRPVGFEAEIEILREKCERNDREINELERRQKGLAEHYKLLEAVSGFLRAADDPIQRAKNELATKTKENR
jgi:hypothetical protein